jgi:hypothetical protein
MRGRETLLISAVLSHAWDERWTSVFEIDAGSENRIPIFLIDPQLTRNSTWYGASTWLLYTYNEHWTGVFRSGIFRDAGGVRTGFNDTFYEATMGLIYKPTAWFWIRPEVDYDGATGAPPFSTRNGRTNNQIAYGFDILFLY